MMHDRLDKYSRASISIYFEQHGKSAIIRENELQKVMDQLVTSIKNRDIDNFPELPSIKSASKEELCLGIADYVAAVFKDYEEHISHSDTSIDRIQDSWQSRYFSRLRSKISVIHNYGTGEFFTRHKPFP